MSRKVNGTYYTKEQAGYAKKYLKNFDEIRIRVPKGEKEALYQEINKRGYESMNQFVREAIYFFLDQ